MSNFNFIGNFLGKSAKLVKDGHDLTNRESFSIPFGVHVPVKHYFCVPGEHYKGNVRGVVQTAPMREDNFQELEMHQKAVFVPMSSICRDYINLTGAKKEVRKDALLNYPLYDLKFNLRTVLMTVFPIYYLQQWISELASEYDLQQFVFSYASLHNNVFYYRGEPVNFEFSRMSNAFKQLYKFTDSGTYFINNPEVEIPAQAFLDKIELFYSSSSTNIAFDVLRILDQLEYGNYLPSYDVMTQRMLESDSAFILFGNRNVPTSSFDDSDFYVNWDPYFNAGSFSNLLPNINCSLWPLLAYQFYIHSYEKSNYRLPSVRALSADEIFSFYANNGTFCDTSLFSSTLLFFDSSTDSYISYLDRTLAGNLRSLASAFRSSLFQYNDDTVNFGDDRAVVFMGYLFSLSNPLLEQDVYNSSQLSVVEGSVPTSSTSELTTNLIQTIADKSALYKLRQDLLRGGVRRNKIMQSIFGVSGNSHVLEPCQILADSANNIQIQGLLNQAETDVAPLGARAARGNGGIGCRFELNTEDYGFLFIIQYVTAPIFYENFGINKSHRDAIGSWWLPQFNHLGLAPLYGSSLSVYDGSRADNLILKEIAPTDIIGYTARDYQLKQQVNLVHGAFTNYGFSLRSFNSVDSSQSYKSETSLVEGNSAFGGFVSTQIRTQGDWYEYTEDLYYKPQLVNNIFVNMVGKGVFNDYSSDHFRCFNVYEVHKVSPMPKIGLLKLDV